MRASTLLLAHAHRLMLDALSRALQPYHAVAGTAEDGPELLARAAEARPEVVIFDLSLPEMAVFEVPRRLRRAGLASRFVALSAHHQASVAAEALRAGISGYVLKSDSFDDLLAAIEAALRGQAFVSPQLPADPLALLLRGGAGGAAPRLTPRQRQVARMVAEGKTMKEAAALMGISTRTAETYKYDLMRRRGLRSNAELVQFAIRLGLLPLPPLDLAA